MATPTGPSVLDKKVGLKKGETWGTAVALGASDQLLCKKLSGLKASRKYSPSDHAGATFRPAGVMTDYTPPDISIGGDLSYELGAIGRHLALLFGTAGTPTKQGATTAYKHEIKWADFGAGFYTLAAEFPGVIYEAPSVMPLGLALKVEDGRIAYEAKGRGDNCKDDSSINGAVQMAALTPALDVPVTFNQLKVYMNGRDVATDVLTTTPLEVSGIEPVFNRNYDSQYVAGSPTIVLPAAADYPDISLKLNFPRFAAVNAAYLAAHIAGTPQKVALQLTSPLEAGPGFYYSITIFYPSMIIQNPDPSREKIIKHSIELVAERAQTNPTGMSSTLPYVAIVNKQSTDYLA